MSPKTIRNHFPILSRKIHNKPLVYFDSAATSLKPKTVIDAVNNYYETYTANTHRGIHTLSEKATEAVENVRQKTARFINASKKEIVFCAGTTDGLNLLAHTLTKHLKAGDRILLTKMEHHSNIVPWQMAAKDKKLKIDFAPLKKDGALDFPKFKKIIDKKPKIVSFNFASNVTGIINPVVKLTQTAKRTGATVIIDAAQAVGHVPINVKKINCDFLVFSAHKMFGPTGVGVLYGKKESLEKMPVFKTGGNVIEKVTTNNIKFVSAPAKFEAGTLPIAQIIGLGAAINFVNKLGFKQIQKHDLALKKYFFRQIERVPTIKLLGNKSLKNRLAIFSFVLQGIPPHDIATLLDEAGIAVRAGHHCAQILHENFGLKSSTRASLHIYNTKEEIDTLIEWLKKITKIFHI